MAENSSVSPMQMINVDTAATTDLKQTKSSNVKHTKNPKIFSALGDVIYDNVSHIVKLKDIDTFKGFSKKIDIYSQKVKKAQEMGFELESGNKEIDKMVYLNTLRTLSKENDYFIRNVNSAYKSSIQSKDSKLFSKVINNGLFDADKHKDEIIEYYLYHSKDVNTSGVIEAYLKKDKKIKTKVKAKKYYMSKKMRDEAKIKRIREADKKEQAKLEKKLTKEVQQKKIEIREKQKKELFN